MKVKISGADYTKFGELWEKSPRTLILEAVKKATEEAKIDISAIEAVYVGNMLSGILGGQEQMGAFITTVLKIKIPALKIEGACASGGLAIHNGVNAILSGQYKKILVVGVEKMTDYKPEEITLGLMGAGADEERQAGATFPGLYALMARAYMEKYRIKEADLAEPAVKNHYHGSLNEKAHFQNRITVEQVLKSSYIARPLKLLDCSPVSDGAAAVILTGVDSSIKLRKGVFIEASETATDTLGLSGRTTLTELPAVQQAQKKAYKKAGILPNDIKVAEVHDCFTIAEIMAMEDLGFCQKGEGANFIKSKATTLGGRGPIINTSGGLKACGHPIGATGVKQIAEIFHQLSNVCGERQVKNAKIGLTHNVGGSGATAVINILKKY